MIQSIQQFVQDYPYVSAFLAVAGLASLVCNLLLAGMLLNSTIQVHKDDGYAQEQEEG